MAATADPTRPDPAARPARNARGRSWTAILALGLYGLVLVLFATFPVLDRMMRDAGRPDLALLAPFVVAPTLAAFTASTVGVVLARRRPRHPVGWLLLGIGLSIQGPVGPPAFGGALQVANGLATRLRDQVDLDALNSELLTVVDQTMQPTRASLWLRSTR